MKDLLLPLQLVDEYLLISRLYIQYYQSPQPPSHWKNGSKDVLLIQGVSEHWNFLKTLGDFLNSKGYRVHTVPELSDNTQPLNTVTQIVRNFIINSDLADLTIISHSKGGLISYNLLSDSKVNHRIKKSISLATPYYGSKMSVLHRPSHELHPNSAVINNLHVQPIDKKNIIAIHSRFDNHVVPHTSLHLEGATNYQLDIVGHTRILVSPQTMQLLSTLLS